VFSSDVTTPRGLVVNMVGFVLLTQQQPQQSGVRASSLFGLPIPLRLLLHNTGSSSSSTTRAAAAAAAAAAPQHGQQQQQQRKFGECGKEKLTANPNIMNSVSMYTFTIKWGCCRKG